MLTLSFQPPFTFPQTAFLSLFFLTAFGLLLFRQQQAGQSVAGFSVRLRSLILLLLLGALWNPQREVRIASRGQKAPFFVLLDASRSMAVADETRNGQTLSRWQAVRKDLFAGNALLRELRQRYAVRLQTFDSTVSEVSEEVVQDKATPQGAKTDIGTALLQAAAGGQARFEGKEAAPVRGGVLLLSDGRDNGTGFPLDAARTARAAGLPVYTLCVGKERKERDLKLTLRNAQLYASPEQKVALAGDLQASGLNDGPVPVTLLREGRPVQTQDVRLRNGQAEFSFTLSEKQKGLYRYAVACAPLAGEADMSNNRANALLTVLDARVRVLLLEGRPGWDAKFLAQTLRDDPTLTLDTIYQLTDERPFALSGRPERTVLHVPKTDADFAQYDVVILGKGIETFFDSAVLAVLKRWISEKGGQLVLLRGQASERDDALQELEPFTYGEEELAQRRLRLTEIGRTYPGFAFQTEQDAQTVVQRLPSLTTSARVQGEKTLAVVLARAQGEGSAEDKGEMALLAYRRFGQGKVLAIAGEGLWRWAFLPPEESAYARVFSDFWTQTVRWLVSESDFLPGQNLALHTDRSTVERREPVTFFGSLRGAKPAVWPAITLTRPDGKTETLPVMSGDGKGADFTAVYCPLIPGGWLASFTLPGEPPQTASTAFTVFPGQEEDANLSADPALMRQIAAAGGGQLLRPDELKTLPERLRVLERESERRREPHPLTANGFYLSAILLLLFAVWTIGRKRRP